MDGVCSPKTCRSPPHICSQLTDLPRWEFSLVPLIVKLVLGFRSPVLVASLFVIAPALASIGRLVYVWRGLMTSHTFRVLVSHTQTPVRTIETSAVEDTDGIEWNILFA